MRILSTGLNPEKLHQFEQMIKEMDLKEDSELLSIALSLLWRAFLAKKSGKDMAIYDYNTDSIELIKMLELERVKPTKLRLV